MYDPKKTITVEFLIAEFNALQERALSSERAKSSTVNFFLLVVAAVTAGLFSVVNFQNFAYLYPIVIISTLAVLTVGAFSLNQLVDYSVVLVIFYRRAGRIRRWFVDFDTELAQYVVFQPDDAHPKMEAPFQAARGGDAILITTNAILAAILVSTAMYPLNYFLKLPLWFFAFGTMAAPLAWYLQRKFIQVKLNRADKEIEKAIHFEK